METQKENIEKTEDKGFWKSLSAEQIVLGIVLTFALIGLLDWLASLFNSYRSMEKSIKKRLFR
jgi:Domain of unknown function (DUF4113)